MPRQSQLGGDDPAEHRAERGGRCRRPLPTRRTPRRGPGRGSVCPSSASEVANIIAPPTPWPLRDAISMSGFTARPHSSEPSVKIASPMRKHQLAAVAVGEHARRQQQRGERQRVGVKRPLHVAEARVQPRLDRRLRHDDDGHVEQQHEHPRADRDEGPPLLVHLAHPLPLGGSPSIVAAAGLLTRIRGPSCRISTSSRLVSVKTSQLDEVDRQLLHALMVAPRASFRQLAAVLEVSDQTVARRYRRLAETAGLRVFGLIDGPRAGWVDWLVRLQAAPGSAQRIADTLAQRPDTRWVRLYSGGTEIVCSLQARSPEQRNALFLRGLPGSRHVTADHRAVDTARVHPGRLRRLRERPVRRPAVRAARGGARPTVPERTWRPAPARPAPGGDQVAASPRMTR